MYNDSLYRLSLKCLIRNDADEILVVKEAGRDFWDLPGGGMDHGESVRTAITRELKEEVDFDGTFTYNIVDLDEPFKLSSRDVWQARVILEIKTDTNTFSVGVDADEIKFTNPIEFKNSKLEFEQKIYEYANMNNRPETYHSP